MGIEKTVKHEGDVYTNCNRCSWYCNHRINRGTGGLGNERTNANHPNYCVIEICLNTEKSPGDFTRLAVTQTPVKDHQLMLRKTLKE